MEAVAFPPPSNGWRAPAEAADPGAVAVAGDFNSTPGMRQFRDLLSNGYRDAVEQTGAGYAPTLPVTPLFPRSPLSIARPPNMPQCRRSAPSTCPCPINVGF